MKGLLRPARIQRNRVLILCEGSKTEPNYFGAVARLLGLTAVSVPQDHDTDPLNLYRRAALALKKDPTYSRVYIVFDRDAHVNFAAAVQAIMQHPEFGSRLFMARSYPSFELWLLLHFSECRTPMTSEQVLSRLKKKYKGYEKGSAVCMDEMLAHVDVALLHADRAMNDAVRTGAMNPSTEVHQLVRYLWSIAD
jgi:hypothetical protein